MIKAFILIFSIIPVIASAEVINNLTSANKYLDKLKNEISEEEKELKTLESTKKHLLKRISVINKKVTYNEEILDKLNSRLAKLNSQKSKLTKEIKNTQELITDLKNQLKRSNTYIIDNKGYTQLKVLVFSKTYHDTIKNMEILEKINDRIYNKINELKQAVDKVEKLEIKYEDTASNLKQLYRAKKNVKEELSNEKLKYKQTLALLKEDKKSKEEYLDILNKKYNMLSNKVKDLRKKSKNNNNDFSTGFSKNKNKLPWPAEGKIIENFGPKKIDGFDGEVFNKGIRISLSQNNIKAVFDGRVKYVDWIRGYGNIVIVQHDKFYYTLYANLDKVFVETDQNVLQGEQVGKVNINTGNNNPTLYFEIRKQNKAVNPLAWLK